MYPKKIQKLIESFSRFPGVGPKTAARFVFYLLGAPEKEINDLSKEILEVKGSLKRCNFCFNFFEGKKDLCEICSNKSRNRETVCVVEKETDLSSIEDKNFYKGLYFVLGGSLSSFKEEEVKNLRIKELTERIKNPKKFGIDTKFKEIILGLNSTLEGESTSLFLKRKLKDLGIKITRLGRGLPKGGELEYADKDTLLSSFKNRG